MTSTSDLDKIKAEQEKLMPETVYVQRLTRTSDGAGGWSESWQTIATTKGRIAAKSGDENELGGKTTTITTYLITLPANTELTNTDRLQINGQQYQIITPLDRSEKTALQVICEKL
jgi:SPP1 family predicted phage head-tail adaptor